MRTDDPATRDALSPAEVWERNRVSWNLPRAVSHGSARVTTTSAFESARNDPDERSTVMRADGRTLTA